MGASPEVKAGANGITVAATDRAGLRATVVVAVTQGISSVPHVVIAAPANGATVSTSTVTVSGTVSSTLAADKIRLSLNGSVQFPTGTGPVYAFSFGNVRLIQGPNAIIVQATTLDGSVSATSVVTLGSAAGPATPPKIAIDAASGGSYQTGDVVTVTGTVTATRCVASVTVNGTPATLSGTGPVVTFRGGTKFAAAGSDSLLAVVSAVDCDGATASATYAVTRDTAAPVVSVRNLSAAPAVTTVGQSPFTVTGIVVEKNLVGLTANDRSVGAVPGAAPDSWDFSVDVGLTRGTDNPLKIEATDRAGNRATFQAVLRLDASVDLSWVSPSEGAELVVAGASPTVDVTARVVGLGGGGSVVASMEGGGSTTLAFSGTTANGAIAVPSGSGDRTIALQARGPGGEVLASAQRRIKVTRAEGIPVAVVKVEPSNGDSNVETNQFLTLSFNRPIDRSKLAVRLLETVHVDQYAPAPKGADIGALSVVNRTRIDRNAEVVPGAVGPIPGDLTATYFAAREFAYGGSVDVTVTYGGAVVSRSSFMTRPVPTLANGFILDENAKPIGGIDVALGATVVSTDHEGHFKFGFGTAQHAIGSGRFTLVVNPASKNARYATRSYLVNLPASRLTQLGTYRVQAIDPNTPYSHIASADARLSLRGGALVVTLVKPGVFFASGRPEGDVQVSVSYGPDVAYPATPISMPFLTYAVQPMGVEATAGISGVEFSIPPTAEGHVDAVSSLPERVLLVGLDASAMQLVPIGVGRMDRAARRIRSEGPVQTRRLDFFGFSTSTSKLAVEWMGSYAAGALSWGELLDRLQSVR